MIFMYTGSVRYS